MDTNARSTQGHSTDRPKAGDVDAAFVELVGRIGIAAEWALGASALLAQQDGDDGSWPAVEPSPRASVRLQARR